MVSPVRGDVKRETHRGYSTPAYLDPDFVDSGRFIPVQGMQYLDNVTNDILDTLTTFDGTGEYRMVFGPCFSSSAQSYACDDRGLRSCLRRMTAVREPARVGYHDALVENQHLWFGGAEVRRFVRVIRRRFMDRLPVEDELELRNMWASMPHPKKRMRELELLEQTGRGDPFCDYERVHNVSYKCKSGELLARRKHLRGIGDLGVAATSVGGFLFDYLKDCFKDEYLLYGRQLWASRFIGEPSRGALKQVFDDLVSSGRNEFFYFSDDSCLGINCRDGRVFANMDIKCCDGSNYRRVIDSVESCMLGAGLDKVVRGVFRQLEKPMVVKGKRFRIKYNQCRYKGGKGRCLYSGHTGTTSVNNVANMGIWLAIRRAIEGMPQLPLKAEIPEIVRRAGEAAGYIVKLEICEYAEDLQFLKHSPGVSVNGYVPFLNFGTMLRSLGTHVGDLPPVYGAKADLQTRAEAFTSDVVKSFVHAGDTELLTALSHLVIGLNSRANIAHKAKFSIGVESSVSRESILRRYRLSDGEYDELIELVSNCGYNSWIRCVAVDKILAKDYGY